MYLHYIYFTLYIFKYFLYLYHIFTDTISNNFTAGYFNTDRHKSAGHLKNPQPLFS